MTVRKPEKFTNIAGSIELTFSSVVEAQFERPSRQAVTVALGADFGYDHQGYDPSPMNPAPVAIRTWAEAATPTLLAAAVDEAMAECQRIGKGYLYRLEADGSTQRRCLARLTVPSITIANGWQFSPGATPLVFQGTRFSEWMGTTATTGSQTIDSPNESVTVNNPGNLPVYATVWRLRNNGTTRAEHPILFNSTTGQYATFNRAMNVSAHELYLDTGSALVQFSDSDGASYQNDYSNFAGSFFRLDPGNNTLRVCCGRPHALPWLNTIGDPNFSLEWSFFANYT